MAQIWKQKVIGDFIIDEDVLGQGCQGVVHKAYYVDKNKYGDHPLAAKMIDKSKIPALSDPNRLEEKKQIIKRLKNEVKIQRSYKNPYIVELIYVKETENNIYMIMEFCEGGDLFKMLEHHKNQGIGQEKALKYFRQICSAFRMLGQHKVCHRDLKPANLLIKNDDIKIADFGFSRIVDLQANQLQITHLGTPMYMSPQNLDSEQYCPFKQDVYAMGLILYEMLYGVHPYAPKDPKKPIDSITQLIKNIKESKLQFDEKFSVSDDLIDLIINMLKYEESERYNWQDVFEHPVVKGYI